MMLTKELSNFKAERFVEETVQNLSRAVRKYGFNGFVFGASGGIDSMVTAALCVEAGGKTTPPVPVTGLQMTDRRVKGESYHPDLYRDLGVELEEIDITRKAVDTEKALHLPARGSTTGLVKTVLRWTPLRLRRRLVLAAKSGNISGRGLRHFRNLTLHHRLRIEILKAFAKENNSMVMICANRTEAVLGYFVEQGVDDPEMGHFAPISSLYKTRVRKIARYLKVPEEIIRQQPSPGFGGIYDEEIIGPYELVDPVLMGFEKGLSDTQIAEEIRPVVEKRFPGREKAYDIKYVCYLRRLAVIAAEKRQTGTSVSRFRSAGKGSSQKF